MREERNASRLYVIKRPVFTGMDLPNAEIHNTGSGRVYGEETIGDLCQMWQEKEEKDVGFENALSFYNCRT